MRSYGARQHSDIFSGWRSGDSALGSWAVLGEEGQGLGEFLFSDQILQGWEFPHGFDRTQRSQTHGILVLVINCIYLVTKTDLFGDQHLVTIRVFLVTIRIYLVTKNIFPIFILDTDSLHYVSLGTSSPSVLCVRVSEAKESTFQPSRP
jgi:hypothetical protein